MPYKILVVEDNSDSRALLHFYFTSAGYTVHIASNGQEGLYMTKVEKPDLIITDLAMSEMDGIEMIKHIRSEPEIAKTPIFVYTAHDRFIGDKVLEAGAETIFYKPMDFEELKKIVSVLLKHSNDK